MFLCILSKYVEHLISSLQNAVCFLDRKHVKDICLLHSSNVCPSMLYMLTFKRD